MFPTRFSRAAANHFVCLSVALVWGAFGTATAETIRVQGSEVIAQAVRGAVPILRSEFGIEVKLFAEVGSTQAIEMIGSELAEVALSTRPVTAEDRAGYPAKRFEEVQVGTQVVALVVSRDVWVGGVRALSKEQAVAIYQGRTKNWKALGGEDRPLKFYNVQRGQGIWELFATWMYGDTRRAPLGKFELVTSAEDTRNTVEFNAGSMSLLSPKYIDGKGLFALGIKLPDGSVVEPTPEAIASRKYPLARPLFLVSADKPTGGVKKLFDFMVTPRGQQLVAKAGFLPIVAASEN